MQLRPCLCAMTTSASDDANSGRPVLGGLPNPVRIDTKSPGNGCGGYAASSSSTSDMGSERIASGATRPRGGRDTQGCCGLRSMARPLPGSHPCQAHLPATRKMPICLGFRPQMSHHPQAPERGCQKRRRSIRPPTNSWAPTTPTPRTPSIGQATPCTRASPTANAQP